MEIRPLTPSDLSGLDEIDATIESAEYLHLTRNAGEGFVLQFSIDQRPLREKLIQSNRLPDEIAFLAKQIATGADEGFAIVADHDGQTVGLLIAQPNPTHNTLDVREVRVDYDLRRQGIAQAMLYQAIAAARERELRAVTAESRTNNMPATLLLKKCGFELTGIDTHRTSNHDLVKEAVTLFWYAALD